MLRLFSEIDSIEFKALFDQWHRKVYYYVLSKTRSEFIAEETVQRVFIKLWKNLSDKNVKVSIEAQIFCITKSVMIDVLREENRRLTRQNEYREEEEHLANPQDIYLLKELQQKLDGFIDSMPEMRKKVFKLSRYEQLSYHEIASKLDIKTKTVENHIYLAIKYLQKLFYKSNLHVIFFFIFF